MVARGAGPSGVKTPTKDGWYALKWPNGTVSVQQFQSGQWQWDAGNGNKLSIPGPPMALAWIGTDVNSLDFWQNANNLAGSWHESPQQQAGLMAQFDKGWFQKGKAFAVGTDGKPVSGSTPGNFGEAAPSNIIPSPSIPGVDLGSILGGIWQFLTTPASWLRILKYIAGAALIFFALKELTGAQVPDVVKRAIP